MRIVGAIVALSKLRFVKDVFTIQVGSMILMIAGFLGSIAFARILGKEQFGQYAVIMAFAATVNTVFNIGQGQSLYVFAAEAAGKNDHRSLTAVIANYMRIGTINCAVLFLVAMFMPQLSLWLYNDETIGKLARIYCIFQMTEVWNGMHLILLQSVRKIRLKVVLEQTLNLCTIGLGVAVLLANKGIQGLLMTQLGIGLIAVPSLAWITHRETRSHPLPTLQEVWRSPLKDSHAYLVQGLFMTADKMMYNFFPQGVFFILSLITPAKVIGMLRISVQIANIPRSILLPQAGDLSVVAFAKMKDEGVNIMRKNAAKLIKHALALHASLTIGAAIAVPFVILYFYGVEYSDAIMPTLWLLLILLLSPLHLVSSPILRLYRKVPLSIAIGGLNWACMLFVLLVLGQKMNSVATFLLTYLTYSAVPLLLVMYIFTVLLPKSSLKHLTSSE